MKNKLKSLKIKLILYGSLTASAMSYTTGCSLQKESITQMSEMQEFNLDGKDSSDYKIIHVMNSFGRENTYFTKICSFKDLNKYSDGNNYRKYFTIGTSFDNATLYIDVFTGIVVSVKHDYGNTISYSFNKIITEENAYDYISSHLDEKEYYNKEEIEVLLLNSIEKNLVKQK